MNNDALMIETENLTKTYGGFTAVNNISFSCQAGEVVGFLGPNGAGKTTTMRMLAGYMPPTGGRAYIAGHDTLAESLEARRRLGYLPETFPLYPEMSVEGYLAFVGKLRRVDNLWERIDDVLEAVDLLDRAESFVGKLSKGMRQRLGLAQALLHEPDVLILDEPTIGLDPAQIREARQLIAELGKNHTILLSTHILSEVEQICNRVIMIFNGQIWADMPLSQAMGGADGHSIRLKLAAPTAEAVAALSALVGVNRVDVSGPGDFQLAFDGRDETRMTIATTAVTAGWGLLELTPFKTSLESIFLNKMKEAEMSRTAVEQYEEEE